MTRCADFYEKWKKDPNWCEKSPETTRLIDHYLELVSVLESHGVELAAIYKKFPEDAARGVFKVKDKSLKEEVIKNIIGKLKRGEKVTNSDISTWAGIERKAKKPTIVGSLTPDSEVKKSNILEKPDSSPAAPVSEFVTGTQIRDGAAPDPAVCQPSLAAQAAGAVPPVPAAHNPPPCKGGGGCTRGKFKVDKVRGNICDAIGAPINQLPGNMCPYDAKLERQAPAAAPKPLQDRTLTITFPPEEWETLENVQRAGEADGFEAAVHVIIQRAGGA